MGPPVWVIPKPSAIPEQIFREGGRSAHSAVAHRRGTGQLAQRIAQERPPIIVAAAGRHREGRRLGHSRHGTASGNYSPRTLNHFARPGCTLDIRRRPRRSSRRAIEVDVAEVNGRGLSTIRVSGLYPHIVLARETQQRRLGRGKWPALFWATLTVLRRSAFMDLRLGLENAERRYRAPLVFIGNNKYLMEGFDIGTRERVDAGTLSIYVTQRRGRLRLLALALRALFGRLHQAADFEALTADAVEITAGRKLVHVAMDGEVALMEAPLRYRIRPRELRVIVPRRLPPEP